MPCVIQKGSRFFICKAPHILSIFLVCFQACIMRYFVMKAGINFVQKGNSLFMSDFQRLPMQWRLPKKRNVYLGKSSRVKPRRVCLGWICQWTRGYSWIFKGCHRKQWSFKGNDATGSIPQKVFHKMCLFFSFLKWFSYHLRGLQIERFASAHYFGANSEL